MSWCRIQFGPLWPKSWGLLDRENQMEVFFYKTQEFCLRTFLTFQCMAFPFLYLKDVSDLPVHYATLTVRTKLSKHIKSPWCRKAALSMIGIKKWPILQVSRDWSGPTKHKEKVKYNHESFIWEQLCPLYHEITSPKHTGNSFGKIFTLYFYLKS